MNGPPTLPAAIRRWSLTRKEDAMKTLATVTLSTQIAIQLIIPNPASAQPTGRGDRTPVLILQQGDVIPETDNREVLCLSGPVNAGEDAVGIAATLNNGGEGVLLIRDHRGRRDTTVLARDVGASSFYINRFGILASPLWGTTHRWEVPWAIKAIMSNSDVVLLTTWGVAHTIGSTPPGLPAKAQVTDIRRLQMLLNGQTYWVADWLRPGESGTAFFRRQPGKEGAVNLLMTAGDMVCDGVLKNLRHFRVAENQSHGHVVDLDTRAGSRTALYVDGSCPYSLGQPLPGGDERPVSFWHFDVNSSGHVLFGAVTDRPSNQNGVSVLDGKVVMREGDVIDGVFLAPPNAGPNEVRLDDRGRAVTLWTGPAASIYTIFYTPDIEHFENTRELISEDTPLDFDDDGIADATLYRFRFFPSSGPTFSLAETGIYIAAWLRYPGSTDDIAAVIFYPF